MTSSLEFADCKLKTSQLVHDLISNCFKFFPYQTCMAARSFWPKVNCKRSSELLALSKVNLVALKYALTGHYPIGTHAVRLNIMRTLAKLSALAALRLKCLGRHIFGEPSKEERLVLKLTVFINLWWAPITSPKIVTEIF